MRKSQEFEETETEGTESATPLKLERAGPTQGTEIAKLSNGRETGSDRKWREGNWQPS